MDSSIISMIAQATLGAQLVLLILILMSLGSWTLMIQKWFLLRRAKAKAIEGIERFQKARDLREAVQVIGVDHVSPLYYVTEQGVQEFNRLKELGNTPDIVVDNVRRALRQGVGSEVTRLASTLTFLATTANTAPFIGLFGTVYGIMHSFHAIGQMKTASLGTVAPGISEALVATAVGLFVAIPATVGYNAFNSALGKIEVELMNYADMFLNRVQREITATRAPSAAGL